MSFSHSSIAIEFVPPAELNARCRNNAGALCFSSIDLDAMLGNNNGSFQIGGNGALKEASDAWLVDSILCANLPSWAGLYKTAKIDLDDLVTNDNGCLKWVDISSASWSTPTHDPDQRAELLSRIAAVSWSTQEATSLRQSLSTSLLRPAIVCAKVPLVNGETDELLFDLDEILINVDGNLVLSFDPGAGNFSTSAQNIKLDGTVLTLELQALNGEYKEHMIDLDYVLAIEGDHLALNSSGPGCTNCRKLFRFGRWYHPDGCYRVEISGLFEPASQNCTICGLLRKGVVTYHGPEQKWTSDTMRVVIETTSRIGYVQIKVCFAMKDISDGHETEAHCALYATKGSANQSITFGGIPSRQFSGSKLPREQRLKLIRTLVDTCASKHATCSSARSSGLPKRVLDLFAKNSSGVTVYSTQGEVAEYACLSHCWGQSTSAMLTKDNLREYQQCVSTGVLPRTYRDAISYCRSLSIRYLWIDSLCILQDDEQDWVTESAKMSAYYGSCFICFAATSSKDHDGGCAIDEVDDISAKGIGQDGLPFDIHLGSLVSNPHFWEVPATSHKHDFPLLTRAWVYQERYLSPRVVHFCKSEIVFECRHMTTCECGQYVYKDRDHQSNTIRSWTKAISPGSLDTSMLAHTRWVSYARPEAGADSWTGSSDPWQDMIESYSQLLLTFQRDKLPAFSGLAAAHLLDDAGAPRSRYLAGLRDNHLIEDLLWFVGGFARGFMTETHLLYAQKSRSHAYVAPSWSWASVADPVHFAYPVGISEVLCNVTKPEVLLSSTVPFGEVTSGHLMVEGKLFPTSWGFVGDTEAPMSYHLWDWEKHEGNNHYAGKHFFPDFLLTKYGPLSADSSEQLYVLPLIRFKGHNNVAAIALRRVVDGEDHDSIPVFERVGWVWRWTAAKHNSGKELSPFPYDVAFSVFRII